MCKNQLVEEKNNRVNIDRHPSLEYDMTDKGCETPYPKHRNQLDHIIEGATNQILWYFMALPNGALQVQIYDNYDWPHVGPNVFYKSFDFIWLCLVHIMYFVSKYFRHPCF